MSLGVKFFDLAWQAVELGSTGRTFLKCLFQRLKRLEILLQNSPQGRRLFWREKQVGQRLQARLYSGFACRDCFRPYGPSHTLRWRCRGGSRPGWLGRLSIWSLGLGRGYASPQPQQACEDNVHSKAAIWHHGASPSLMLSRIKWLSPPTG